MIFKLAFRNIIGRGVRTWLNVVVLSIVMVTIVGFQGIYEGWQNDGEKAMINWHVAAGQYWHPGYDPYDAFSYEQSRQKMPLGLQDDAAVEFIVSQGVVYPQGRMKNITLRGVEEKQSLLALPTAQLSLEEGRNKIMLGERSARKLKVEEGDKLILRWRDSSGSFDAQEFEIVDVFSTLVAGIDQGQVWLGIEQLRQMLKISDEVNYFSVSKPQGNLQEEWEFKSQRSLLEEFRSLVAAKKSGGMFMYLLLMFLAMIAVFDTQVLSLFKRRKETGMMMAVGMGRKQIMGIFVLEGFISGMLALVLGIIWGAPLLMGLQKKGIALPQYMDSYGVDGITDKLYPAYSISLVLITLCVIMLIILVTSYLPVRKISKLRPVDALSGKFSV